MTREERGRDDETRTSDGGETSDTGKEAFDDIEDEIQEERKRVFGEEAITTDSGEESTTDPDEKSTTELDEESTTDFDEESIKHSDEKITTESDEESTTDSDEEITPQSEALRQQQYVVGVGVAVLAGVALAIGSFQRFPDLPTAVPGVFGLLGAALVYWIVKHSLYPTERQLPLE